jgi:hypothetical protein
MARRKPRFNAQHPSTFTVWLARAVALGLVAGLGSVLLLPNADDTIADRGREVLSSMGLARARAPQEGDYWPNCEMARNAGTAPLYADEPGFSDRLDGNGDGIACEF